jgi:hypothetical protein
MRNLLRCVCLAALAWGITVPAVAGDLKLTIENGRVTIVAQDVPLAQILQEWARLGNTKIVNAEKIVGTTVTLELVNVPERQALDTLLRSTAGYLAAPRPAGVMGASVYDRIMILPTSRPPAAVAAAAPPPAFQPRQQPMLNPADDDDDQPLNMQMVNPNVGGAYPNMPPMGQPPTVVQPNGQPGGAQMPVLTSPRPGALPNQPPNGAVPQPYQPLTPNGVGNPNLPAGATPNLPPSVIRPTGPGGPGGPGDEGGSNHH